MPHLTPDTNLLVFLIAALDCLLTLNATQKPDTGLIRQHLISLLTELQKLHSTHQAFPKSKSDQLVVQFKRLLLQKSSPKWKPKDFAQTLCVSILKINLLAILDSFQQLI